MRSLPRSPHIILSSPFSQLMILMKLILTGTKYGGGVPVQLQRFIERKIQPVLLRRKVLNNKETDPFDSYTWIADLHRPYKLNPAIFPGGRKSRPV